MEPTESWPTAPHWNVNYCVQFQQNVVFQGRLSVPAFLCVMTSTRSAVTLWRTLQIHSHLCIYHEIYCFITKIKLYKNEGPAKNTTGTHFYTFRVYSHCLQSSQPVLRHSQCPTSNHHMWKQPSMYRPSFRVEKHALTHASFPKRVTRRQQRTLLIV